MGQLMSKIFNLDTKSNEKISSGNVKELKKADLSSSDSLKTPDYSDKFIADETCNFESGKLKVKTRLFKNLKLDPRSPTVGINRTPIIVEDANSFKKSFTADDSPLSIYSSNISFVNSSDIATPTEPSMNVSGFEESSEYEFSLTGENKDEINEESAKISYLKVTKKPCTFEGKQLFKDIKSSFKDSPPKKLKDISIKDPENPLKTYSCNDFKGISIKSRTPLTNITLSANSPSKNVNVGSKLFSRSKALQEFGSENVIVPTVKEMSQWDQNNTVII